MGGGIRRRGGRRRSRGRFEKDLNTHTHTPHHKRSPLLQKPHIHTHTHTHILRAILCDLNLRYKLELENTGGVSTRERGGGEGGGGETHCWQAAAYECGCSPRNVVWVSITCKKGVLCDCMLELLP
jgi:hypothetical protein